jgi:hypothetical protein
MVKPVYAKYYDERNFWSFTRAFSIFSPLFHSSHPRGNEAFSPPLYFAVMSLECVNTMSSTAGQARPANLASNVIRVTKDKGNA